MSSFQPPPTYAEVVLTDPTGKAPPRFNPIWLNWFLRLTGSLTAGGSGSVTSVAVMAANGISGSVANATTTPAITLALGAITPTSVAATAAISGTTVKATTAAGYISSDGSTGYTGTVTTASLVGKTITIKDGIITGFA
jgi:hypothetical protein